MITILYDNRSGAPELRADWGFACVVHGLPRTILFDTGASGEVLLHNMDVLGVAPAEIDAVVLSHSHGDHTGGLADILRHGGNVSVYVPSAFPAGFKEDVRRAGAQVVETDGPEQVCPGAATTGVLGGEVKEQALWLDGRDGAVLITGCAHPGVLELVRAAAGAAGSPVHTVLGGFHLRDESSRGIARVIEGLRELGVQRAGPCHCSGDKAQAMMRDAFGDGYMDLSVGRTVEWPLPGAAG